jgi:hypothetical protein
MREAEAERLIARLSKLTGVKTTLRWEGEVAAASFLPLFNTISFGNGFQEYLDQESILLHEFVHAVAHKRGEVSAWANTVEAHGGRFYATLKEVVAAHYGDATKYNWWHEYPWLAAWAEDEGLCHDCRAKKDRLVKLAEQDGSATNGLYWPDDLVKELEEAGPLATP